jgi:hypothetical protein
MARHLRLLVALALAWLPVPADAAAPAPRQYLDQRSGATVTVAAQPLVFARERPELAVNARDYVSLSAIDVNRGGRHARYWWVYLWSTIDRGGQAPAPAITEWLLVADGRPLPLAAVKDEPAALGIVAPPVARPSRRARALLFSADADLLRFIAASRTLGLQAADGSEVFELWRDARPALAALAARQGE